MFNVKVCWEVFGTVEERQCQIPMSQFHAEDLLHYFLFKQSRDDPYYWAWLGIDDDNELELTDEKVEFELCDDDLEDLYSSEQITGLRGERLHVADAGIRIIKTDCEYTCISGYE